MPMMLKNDPLFGNVVLATPFDEGAVDYSDAARSLTLNGGAALVAANFDAGAGKSCSCPHDAAKYLSAASSSDFDLPGDFTISFWFYFADWAYANSVVLIDRWAGGVYPTERRWKLETNSGGYLTFTLNNSTVTRAIAGSQKLSALGWQHIEVTCESGVGRLFKNGVLIGSNSSMGAVSGASPADCELRFGTTCGGYFDEIVIDNTAAWHTADFDPPASYFAVAIDGDILATTDAAASTIELTHTHVSRILAATADAVATFELTHSRAAAIVSTTEDAASSLQLLHLVAPLHLLLPLQLPEPVWRWEVSPTIPGQRIYRCTITGAADGLPDAEVAIASLQARSRTKGQSYLQVIVPWTIDAAAAVADRPGGELVITSGMRFADGSEALTEILRAQIDTITRPRGGRNASITIVGYGPAITGSGQKRTVAAARSLTLGPTNQVQGEIDLWLLPGDIAVEPSSGTEITANLITYTVGPRDQSMTVSDGGG